jgi:hypothetical protein
VHFTTVEFASEVYTLSYITRSEEVAAWDDIGEGSSRSATGALVGKRLSGVLQAAAAMDAS